MKWLYTFAHLNQTRFLIFSSCNFKRGAPCHPMNPIITSTEIFVGKTAIGSLTIELEKLLVPLRAVFKISSQQGFSSHTRLLTIGAGLQRPIDTVHFFLFLFHFKDLEGKVRSITKLSCRKCPRTYNYWSLAALFKTCRLVFP